MYVDLAEYYLPANDVSQTNSHTSPENREATIIVFQSNVLACLTELGLENDGHNNTVNSHGFAENNTK